MMGVQTKIIGWCGIDCIFNCLILECRAAIIIWRVNFVRERRISMFSLCSHVKL
ncbi:hypothetical protein Lalb_Chr11g0067861 [Lupinus albus]|uniref:Uncharacterized protein n=1 Tax=Lupinus albus TaxID=3870 RepID=A0A6A4PR51_LUPAL|nr:hypothetical protein Lalb_Chr11g0067861 [Lupinus albus]